MSALRATATACVASLLLAASCGGSLPPDVLLVSLDTLRADHLSCYGYSRDTSPFLDELAAEGVRFARAWASASNTAPSHMSLFTGLDPFAHGIRPVVVGEEPVVALSPECPTLAELLGRAGYRTIALADDGYILPQMGFDRGFDRFENERTSLAEKVTSLGTALKEVDPERPLFLFFHTYETHAPYLPPPKYHGRFTDPAHRGPFRERYEALVGRPVRDTWEARGTFLEAPEDLRAEDLDFLRALYDESIAYTDDMLRRAWALWGKWRDPEHTVLAVVSDHGEGFDEHGQLGHRYGLFAELLHVPLILRAPGLAPAVVEDDVGLVDFVPTLLELLALPAPSSLQGRSFLDLARAQTLTDARPPAFSQLNSRKGPHDAITSGDLRLLRWNGAARTKLFDRSRDPQESEDLSALRPDDVARLDRLLEERRQIGVAHNERFPHLQGTDLSAAQQQELTGMGYFGEDPEEEPRRARDGERKQNSKR